MLPNFSINLLSATSLRNFVANATDYNFELPLFINSIESQFLLVMSHSATSVAGMKALIRRPSLIYLRMRGNCVLM